MVVTIICCQRLRVKQIVVKIASSVFAVYIFLTVKCLLQEKPKMGTMESLKFLVSSRYIRDLATLVVAYGISINLVEVTWKSKLKAQVN